MLDGGYDVSDYREINEHFGTTAEAEAFIAEAGDLGAEFTRMASYGNVVPDLWMRNATGSPVSAEPLIAAARKALDHLQN